MNIKQPTILTNLQRGNVKQESPVLLYQRSIYELAAQGELYHIEPHSVDTVDENYMTPLIWAAGYGQILTVEYLIRTGANPNHKSIGGKTALIIAASKGYLHVVRALIRGGANVNQLDDLNCSALMYAAYEDHSLVVQELLKCGANLGAVNSQGKTAYSIALVRQNKCTQATIESHLVAAIRGHRIGQTTRLWY